MLFSGLGSRQGSSGPLHCEGGGRQPCQEAQCNSDERTRAIQRGHVYVQSGGERAKGEIGGGRPSEVEASRGGDGLA